MDRLYLEKQDLELETRVVEDVSKLRPLLNKDCMGIFSELKKQPSYPAELAKKLGMNEQKAYYYIKQLKNAGLIEVKKEEEKKGAIARYYGTTIDSFSIVPNLDDTGKNTKILKMHNRQSDLPEFLSEFTSKGVFSAKMVVGSPDPHGLYKARARDGHLSAELAAFIGAHTSGLELPLIFLDTMVNDLNKENSNLIIIGGPVTNKLAEQANQFLPIKFSPSGGNWAIKSEATGKEYLEDSVGVIEKIQHPYYKGKWLLLIAGKRNTGTIAAIHALAKKTSKATKTKDGSKEFARVVEGLDLNGDGLIDEVEFKE